MMLQPGHQICLWPCMSLNFDFLTSKVDYFMPLPHRPLVPLCVKINIVFTSLVTDE